MWTILLLLWSIPLALELLIITRIASGSPAVSEKEWRFFFGENEDFGDTKEMPLSLWMGLKFALILVLFFAVGVVEGLVLINLGSFWFVVVPLLTGLGAMLLVVLWVRSGSSANGISHRNTPRSEARARRTPGILSR